MSFYSNSRLRLSSAGWKDTVTWVYLIFLILNILTILYCCLVVARRPWLKQDGRRSRSKYLLFVFASIMALLGLSIDIVNIILHQCRISTTYSYFIIYIFRSLGFRAADVLIIAVFYKCIQESRNTWLSTTNHRKLTIFHLCLVLVLAALHTAGFILYTRYIATLIEEEGYVMAYLGPLELTRTIVSFLIAIEILITCIIFTIKKAVSKQTQYLLLLTSTALTISTTFSLITALSTITPVPNISSSSSSNIIFSWTYNFILIITTIIIFTGLAFLSRQSNKTIHDTLLTRRISKFGVRRDDENNRDSMIEYASPSPYAEINQHHHNNDNSPYEVSGYQYDPVSRSVYGFGSGSGAGNETGSGQQYHQPQHQDYIITAPEVHHHQSQHQHHHNPYQVQPQPVSPVRGTYYNGTGTGAATITGGYAPVATREYHGDY